MRTEELIQKTVNATIKRLKAEGMIRDDTRTAAEKCEGLLRCYPELKLTRESRARYIVNEIDRALTRIKDDSFYQIIPMYYFDRLSISEIAERLHTSESTISRGKQRLIDRLKIDMFTDDFLNEIL